MQSAHCRMRVSDAIKTVEGVSIVNIEPGAASISIENEVQQNAVFKAIDNAGYTVQEIHLKTDTVEENYRFKTNINCSSCVEKVTPALQAVKGVCHWDVDTGSKDKTLSVHSIGISKQEVIDTVKNAGFNIEEINS